MNMTWWCCQQRLRISRTDGESLKWWLNPECCSRQAANVQIKCKFDELNRNFSYLSSSSSREKCNFVFIALWIHFRNCSHRHSSELKEIQFSRRFLSLESDENNSKPLEDEIQLSKSEINWIIIKQVVIQTIQLVRRPPEPARVKSKRLKLFFFFFSILSLLEDKRASPRKASLINPALTMSASHWCLPRDWVMSLSIRLIKWRLCHYVTPPLLSF